MAPAPQSNASGTLMGLGRANQQSNGGEPTGNSQETDPSNGQGNAMQYQWSYGDNDQQDRTNPAALNTHTECFDNKIENFAMTMGQNQ